MKARRTRKKNQKEGPEGRKPRTRKNQKEGTRRKARRTRKR